jgi:hypothetical protein
MSGGETAAVRRIATRAWLLLAAAAVELAWLATLAWMAWRR